ncbi:MAG: peptidoglycan DD-metalloendopeptidase family protein [Lachnospiraceae bacterium]|nr:peptidoglycan DD-metalloendopeptidase family protein [Lachnospiraceae bacterium]
MAEKISTQNKIRADTSDVNSARITDEDTGRSVNMTGGGDAAITNVSTDKKTNPQRRNMTRRIREDADGKENVSDGYKEATQPDPMPGRRSKKAAVQKWSSVYLQEALSEQETPAGNAGETEIISNVESTVSESTVNITGTQKETPEKRTSGNSRKSRRSKAVKTVMSENATSEGEGKTSDQTGFGKFQDTNLTGSDKSESVNVADASKTESVSINGGKAESIHITGAGKSESINITGAANSESVNVTGVGDADSVNLTNTGKGNLNNPASNGKSGNSTITKDKVRRSQKRYVTRRETDEDESKNSEEHSKEETSEGRKETLTASSETDTAESLKKKKETVQKWAKKQAQEQAAGKAAEAEKEKKIAEETAKVKAAEKKEEASEDKEASDSEEESEAADGVKDALEEKKPEQKDKKDKSGKQRRKGRKVSGPRSSRSHPGKDPELKQAKEAARAQKRSVAAMTAVSLIRKGAWVDSNDHEELSEKIVRNGNEAVSNVRGLLSGNVKGNAKAKKEKGGVRAKQKEVAEEKAKKKTPEKEAEKTDKEKVTAKAKSELLEKKKKEQAKEKKDKIHKKELQKHRIRKNYAKEVRETKKKKQAATSVARKIQEAVSKHSAVIVILLILLIVFLICASLLGSCALGFTAMSGEVSESSFLSKPVDIENCELELQYQEMLIQYQIDTMSTTYPGFDEYHVQGGPLAHDPMALIAYLSAKYGEFTYADVCAEVDDLIGHLYYVEFVTSKRGPYTTYVPDGHGGYKPDDYYISELTAKITVTPFDEVAAANLTDEQMERYNLLMETRGVLQRYAPPVSGWQNCITEAYGIHSSRSGGYQNNGTTLHVSEGTSVQAMCSGTVTEAGSDGRGNYITITNEKGYVAKISGLSSLNYSVGSEVKLKEEIGTSNGIIYFEISYDGVYYNPVYFVNP